MGNIISNATAVFILEAKRFSPLKGHFPDLNGLYGL